MGTEDTSNQLYQEGDDSYSHITVAYEMSTANFNLLQFLSHSLKPGHNEADCILLNSLLSFNNYFDNAGIGEDIIWMTYIHAKPS